MALTYKKSSNKWALKTSPFLLLENEWWQRSYKSHLIGRHISLSYIAHSSRILTCCRIRRSWIGRKTCWLDLAWILECPYAFTSSWQGKNVVSRRQKIESRRQKIVLRRQKIVSKGKIRVRLLGNRFDWPFHCESWFLLFQKITSSRWVLYVIRLLITRKVWSAAKQNKVRNVLPNPVWKAVKPAFNDV